MIASQSETFVERFWMKVNKAGPVHPTLGTACWLWTAAILPCGYGQFHNLKPHRISYELEVGPIPTGLVIDHLCRVRACVNPAHLEPVTQRENIMRGDGVAAKNAVKTHCAIGHEFAGANLRVCKGQRICRECNRLAVNRYHARCRLAASS